MAKYEVCKSGMFDLRVDFCHLDPKSRANHLEHFRTLNMTSFGLGIAKGLRGGCILEKQEVNKSGMFDLRVDFCHLDPKSIANYLEHFRTLNGACLGLWIAKNLIGGYTLKFGFNC